MKALIGVSIPLLAFGLFFYLAAPRPQDPPPPPTLADASAPSLENSDLDGVWQVTDGWVGYRILERITRLYGEWEAVGRSDEVAGELLLEDGQVVDAEIRADLFALASESRSRDRNLQVRYLESEIYPDATFRLSEPIGLLGEPLDGEPASVSARGELTLREITQPVSASLESVADGDGLLVVGEIPITLADFDIDPPRMPGFRFVEDEGVAELRLRFVPADRA